jgi:predicted nucleic acid-binding protein
MGKREKKSAVHKVIFDTDVLIWYFRGDEKAGNFLADTPFASRLLPSVAYLELLQGCSNKSELITLERMIQTNFAEVLHPNEEISERAISLMRKHSLSHGLTTFDALIAATALEHGYHLATSNLKHYRYIENLKMVPFVRSK